MAWIDSTYFRDFKHSVTRLINLRYSCNSKTIHILSQLNSLEAFHYSVLPETLKENVITIPNVWSLTRAQRQYFPCVTGKSEYHKLERPHKVQDFWEPSYCFRSNWTTIRWPTLHSNRVHDFTEAGLHQSFCKEAIHICLLSPNLSSENISRFSSYCS